MSTARSTQLRKCGWFVAALVALPEYFCLMGQKDTDKLAVREGFGSGEVQDFLARQAKSLGLWIVIQFVNGVGSMARTDETGGVAYMAHIGGFVAGLVLVKLFAAGGPRARAVYAERGY